MWALPHTPLKELFGKSSLRIFKNFEKRLIFSLYTTLRLRYTEGVCFIKVIFASGLMVYLKVRSASAPRLDALASVDDDKLRSRHLPRNYRAFVYNEEIKQSKIPVSSRSRNLRSLISTRDRGSK